MGRAKDESKEVGIQKVAEVVEATSPNTPSFRLPTLGQAYTTLLTSVLKNLTTVGTREQTYRDHREGSISIHVHRTVTGYGVRDDAGEVGGGRRSRMMEREREQDLGRPSGS